MLKKDFNEPGKLMIYKASAGSGKTFTLTVQYIKQLVIDPTAYKQILAVTFTNKATTEMKERIMQQLYGIWMGDKSSDAYINAILKELDNENKHTDKDTVQKNAGIALHLLIHDYSRFKIETIDSFFQSVMKNLARELELSPNLNIELNNGEVLEEAVDRLIENITPKQELLKLLLDYIQDKINQDKQWNVSREIKNFGFNIFDEQYIEKGEKLRKCLDDFTILRNYKDLLEDLLERAMDIMKAHAEHFEEVLQRNGLKPEDLKYGKNGIASYFAKIKKGNWGSDICGARMKDCIDNENGWFTKTSAKADNIRNLVYEDDGLNNILKKTEEDREMYNRTQNSCTLALRYINQLQLLNHIAREVRDLNKEANRFLLSDTTSLLHSLINKGDSSFIFEKIGANIKTIMIDEFQDTSRMQWDNFLLLLEEGLSQGTESLIVGDIKQSIYRWRNGDWKILNNLTSGKRMSNSYGILGEVTEVRTLDYNHRSEANIIHFNNFIFRNIIKYLHELSVDSEHPENSINFEPLLNAYSDVEQKVSKTDVKGYVKVQFIEKDETISYNDQTIIQLGEEIKSLITQGVNVNDIAILVRKNKNIPPIASFIEKELQLPVISDEAFALGASQAVNMLISILRYLSNPENKIALASIILSYYSYGNKTPLNCDQLLKGNAVHYLPQSFVKQMEELKLRSLYEIVEECYSIFSMQEMPNQEAYLFSFYDAIIEYIEKNPSDIDDFLEYWDNTLFNKNIPGGDIEGIRIMSIHKSKGLEFHTLLIPFCDWKMENERNDQLLWCTPEDEPYNHLDLLPISYSSKMNESTFSSAYKEEKLQLWVDNLNLLYVAFTRAEKNLIIWSKKDLTGTMSELLKVALSEGTEVLGEWTTPDECYEFGSLCPSSKEKKKVIDSNNRLASPAEPATVQMESHRYNVEFLQSNDSAQYLSGHEESDHNELIQRGKLLHTLFSRIQTKEDIPNAIERLIFEGVITDDDRKNIEDITHYAFQQPNVQNWYSGDWKVINECDILWNSSDGAMSRRPDRVMMNDNEIIVVDFKFGKPLKKYHKQVSEYIKLIRQIYPNISSVKGYLWYVELGEIENV